MVSCSQLQDELDSKVAEERGERQKGRRKKEEGRITNGNHNMGRKPSLIFLN